MDSLQQLLGDRGVPAEPPEIQLIKSYVRDEFQATVDVMVRERDIVIAVTNASLANTLRLRGPQLKKLCRTDKRLTFRIG